MVCMEEDGTLSAVNATYSSNKISYQAYNFNFYTLSDVANLGGIPNPGTGDAAVNYIFIIICLGAIMLLGFTFKKSIIRIAKK